MYRYLLKIGPVTVYAYGAMLALAFLVGIFIASSRAARYGLDKNKILDLVFVILVSSLAGARLLFVALNGEYYFKQPQEIPKLWEGGLVLYGGVIAGLIAALVFVKRNGLSFAKAGDVLCVPFALGIAIGRIGCFLNGCCWGKLSEKWGVCFPARDNPPVFAQQVYEGLIPLSAAKTLPVLPTQLYEAAACLAIFFALLLLERGRRKDGLLFWSFILMYGCTRFAIEGLRYYEANFFFGILTVSQIISIGFILAAVGALAFLRGQKSPPV